VEATYSHLALNVADLATSTAFYVDAFGFAPGRPYTAGGRRLASFMAVDPAGFDGVFLRCDGGTIELLAHRGASSPAETPRSATRPGVAHISFLVTSIDDAVRQVEAAGGFLLSRMDHVFAADQPTRIAFCVDPDGNRIELLEHPDADEARAHATFLGAAGLGWPPARAN
jgi:glyoxylase I family protein